MREGRGKGEEDRQKEIKFESFLLGPPEKSGVEKLSTEEGKRNRKKRERDGAPGSGFSARESHSCTFTPKFPIASPRPLRSQLFSLIEKTQCRPPLPASSPLKIPKKTESGGTQCGSGATSRPFQAFSVGAYTGLRVGSHYTSPCLSLHTVLTVGSINLQ